MDQRAPAKNEVSLDKVPAGYPDPHAHEGETCDRCRQYAAYWGERRRAREAFYEQTSQRWRNRPLTFESLGPDEFRVHEDIGVSNPVPHGRLRRLAPGVITWNDNTGLPIYFSTRDLPCTCRSKFCAHGRYVEALAWNTDPFTPAERQWRPVARPEGDSWQLVDTATGQVHLLAHPGPNGPCLESPSYDYGEVELVTQPSLHASVLAELDYAPGPISPSPLDYDIVVEGVLRRRCRQSGGKDLPTEIIVLKDLIGAVRVLALQFAQSPHGMRKAWHLPRHLGEETVTKLSGVFDETLALYDRRAPALYHPVCDCGVVCGRTPERIVMRLCRSFRIHDRFLIRRLLPRGEPIPDCLRVVVAPGSDRCVIVGVDGGDESYQDGLVDLDDMSCTCDSPNCWHVHIARSAVEAGFDATDDEGLGFLRLVAPRRRWPARWYGPSVEKIEPAQQCVRLESLEQFSWFPQRCTFSRTTTGRWVTIRDSRHERRTVRIHPDGRCECSNAICLHRRILDILLRQGWHPFRPLTTLLNGEGN